MQIINKYFTHQDNELLKLMKLFYSLPSINAGSSQTEIRFSLSCILAILRHSFITEIQ